MRYRAVITEVSIDETIRPAVFRCVLEAETESEAVVLARESFSGHMGREPAPRAIFDVVAL